MSQDKIPHSILFCCDHNSVRSPMAEGMMKKFYGRAAYVQSAGVRGGMDVDGFAISVCDEIGVVIANHRSRSFDEMQDWGDDLGGFDLIVALSPARSASASVVWSSASTTMKAMPAPIRLSSAAFAPSGPVATSWASKS